MENVAIKGRGGNDVQHKKKRNSWTMKDILARIDGIVRQREYKAS